MAQTDATMDDEGHVSGPARASLGKVRTWLLHLLRRQQLEEGAQGVCSKLRRLGSKAWKCGRRGTACRSLVETVCETPLVWGMMLCSRLLAASRLD